VNEEATCSGGLSCKDNSELGCQIRITEEIDGLELEITPDNNRSSENFSLFFIT
jgi:2Fe-2S ferredoxin